MNSPQIALKPVFQAIENDDKSQLDYFTRDLSVLSLCGDYGFSALEYSAYLNRYLCCKLLIDKGVDINYGLDNTPIIVACINNHARIIELFVSKKADIYKSNDYSALWHIINSSYDEHSAICSYEEISKYPNFSPQEFNDCDSCLTCCHANGYLDLLKLIEKDIVSGDSLPKLLKKDKSRL